MSDQQFDFSSMTVEDMQNEINACKILLRQHDYESHKHSEGCMTDEEFAEIKASRQRWRDKINALEEAIASHSESDIATE